MQMRFLEGTLLDMEFETVKSVTTKGGSLADRKKL